MENRLNFTSLRIYHLSEILADEIWHIVQKWDYFPKDTLGKQIIRSADSIGTNIAEGTAKNEYIDNQRFVTVAISSLNETTHWLRRAYARKLLTLEQISKIQSIIDELSPKLNASLSSIEYD